MAGASMEPRAPYEQPATAIPGCSARSTKIVFTSTSPRGLFIVIDGVGGQAAGGKAADAAVRMLRARLERETGPMAMRLREAITIANNEIHRLAGQRAEWSGMACVLTVAVVTDGVRPSATSATRGCTSSGAALIEKVTRDHSPVGEREDAQRDVRSSKRCGTRAATRCTATSARKLHEPAIPISSTSRRFRSSPTPACCCAATV